MTITNPLEAFGHTVFCDDIRHELGGKITLVGTYHHAMFVHGDFPFTVPKFGLHIAYSERLDVFGTKKSILRVYASWMPNEHPLIEQELLLSQNYLKEGPETPGLPPPTYAHLGLQVIFAPLIVGKPGEITVRVIRGEHTIGLGSLRIGKAPKPAAV